MLKAVPDGGIGQPVDHILEDATVYNGNFTLNCLKEVKLVEVHRDYIQALAGCY